MDPQFLKSLVLRWLSLIVLAVLASVLLASCGGNQGVPLVFSATLVGTEETPPNDSFGQGVGILLFQPDSRQFSASVIASGLTGTVAHIHQGAPGVAGPIIFPLTREGSGMLWTTSGTLTLPQVVTLQTGNYYFNVHSPSFPDGEIRGQILFKTPSQLQLQQLQLLRQQSPLLDQQLRLIEPQMPSQ